jgi:hypothetical protein
MACLVNLAAGLDERLAVSTTVHHTGEAACATIRFRIVGEPAEVSVTSPDVPALIHGLLRTAQQLCDKAITAVVPLPGDDWARAALLLDDALVAIAETEHEQSDG